MALDDEKIKLAITQSRQGKAAYYDIDETMKCELFTKENKIRIMVCFYRRNHSANQLIDVVRKRHIFPDQYADILVGTDKDMNLYAGKTIALISPVLVVKEVENISEYLKAS